MAEQARDQATTTYYGLSARELAVLELVVEGLSDEQIAEALSTSVDPVKEHVASLLEKMGATSRTEGAARALRDRVFEGGTGG